MSHTTGNICNYISDFDLHQEKKYCEIHCFNALQKSCFK